MKRKVERTEEEWREKLDPESFRVLRKAGTERPFTGAYNLHFEDGVYSCKACNEPLFSSETKYDHGCGWPSFYAPIDRDKIEYRLDKSHGMTRVEILCATCESHLGHVFNDGIGEKGERYCVNSASLDFEDEGSTK